MPLIRGKEPQMGGDRQAYFRIYAIDRRDARNLLEGYMHREGPVDRVAALSPKPPAHNGLNLLPMDTYGGVMAFVRRRAAKSYADAVKGILTSAGYTSVTVKPELAYARELVPASGRWFSRPSLKPAEPVYIIRVNAKW